MEFGVQAIFGPSDPILGAHIQSICEGKFSNLTDKFIGNIYGRVRRKFTPTIKCVSYPYKLCIIPAFSRSIY